MKQKTIQNFLSTHNIITDKEAKNDLFLKNQKIKNHLFYISKFNF